MNFNPMDMLNMLKNPAALQDKMQELEAQLKAITVSGESGGGLVKVTLNGRFECLAIELDPVAVDNRDVPMLQTLIKSAHHAAFIKISEELKSKAGAMGLQRLLGGLQS
ncbi:MAG: YbaB/EbfC family nucleoid-associated protein [Spirochaetaceae bacterium]|nr:YbaB/EbfC family nucleoid-associated protein [Spirochaetaceae bacterium]